MSSWTTIAGPSVGDTSNSIDYTSSSFTPTAGKQLVVCIGYENPGATVALNASANGLTFTLAKAAPRAASAEFAYVYYANQVTPGSPSAMTVTLDSTDAGAGTGINWAFMELDSLHSVVQAGSQDNGNTASTPAVTMAGAIQTGNPVLGLTFHGTNPAGVTEPSGFTEAFDIGKATPARGIEVCYANSGITATTVTWGSTTATTKCSILVEFTPSGGGSVSSTIAWTEDDDAVVASMAENIASTAAWTEDDDTVVAASAENIAATAAWTEADDTVAATMTHTTGVAASAAWTEDDDAWAATAFAGAVSSAAWTEDDDQWVAAVTNASPVSFTAAWAESDDSWSAAVTVTNPVSNRFYFVPPRRTRQVVADVRTGLLFEESYGMTVINTSGSYRLVEQPTQRELIDADAYYLGGHRTEITAAEKTALETAGYSSGIETV